MRQSGAKPLKEILAHAQAWRVAHAAKCARQAGKVRGGAFEEALWSTLAPGETTTTVRTVCQVCNESWTAEALDYEGGRILCEHDFSENDEIDVVLCSKCHRTEAEAMAADYYQKLLQFSRHVCMCSNTEFRGECGRDGAPETDWCLSCQARAAVGMSWCQRCSRSYFTAKGHHCGEHKK